MNAEVVLGLFIPLSIGLFFVLRPLTAAMVAVLGAEMFLPEGVCFKYPLLPELTKYNLAALCTTVGCMLTWRRKFVRTPKRTQLAMVAIAMIASSLGTALTNPDPVSFGEVFFPGLTPKDGFYIALKLLIPALGFFYVGYALVRERADVEKVLSSLAIAGLIYCPLAIVEMRLSPLLHTLVYGYDTGGFAMTVRYGGYRPKIFMTHGLTVARFFMATTLAIFILAKHRRTLLGLPTRLLAWFHLLILILCRSTGAVIMTVTGLLFIKLARPKRQLLFAAIVGSMTLLYPLLRSWELFPVTGILSGAGDLSADRAESLEFRFKNEDILLARARERSLFGWGFGRNFVLYEDGTPISVVDGEWIIVMGVAGTAGFLLQFVVLIWPAIWARSRLRSYGDPVDREQLAGIAILVALWGSDMIPNGLWGMHGYMLAGALCRRLVELRSTPRAVSPISHQPAPAT
jgi:hypothetical protein